MKKFICYRILSLVPIVLLSSFCVFCLLRLGGSDPVMMYIMHSQIPATEEMIATLRAEFGLDKPLLEQYFLWLKDAIMLDFGDSYMNGRAVSEDFLRFLPNTLLLVLFGFILTLLFALPLGFLSMYYHNKLPDMFIRIFCFIGVSMPNFWLGFLLILCFSIYLGWLPAVGIEGDGIEQWKSFILPSISIALMSICILTRLIATNMLEVAKERHIIYAKMRGIGGLRLYIRHIFYNAFLPVLTAMGMHIGELIGGALIIESVFGIPGIGAYSITGIANHDYPIIECFIVVLSVCFVLCNAIIDILYAFLDPRIAKQLSRTYSRRGTQGDNI